MQSRIFFLLLIIEFKFIQEVCNTYKDKSTEIFPHPLLKPTYEHYICARAKGSNFKEDDRALPYRFFYCFLIHLAPCTNYPGIDIPRGFLSSSHRKYTVPVHVRIATFYILRLWARSG